MESLPEQSPEMLSDIKILAKERVVNVEHLAARTPARPPSGLRELYRLARAKFGNELNTLNPPLASLAMESDEEAPPELRRYEALFGRDSLRVAIDVLPLYPQLTRATIITLAEFQGTQTNQNREEEPGRIPHEIRSPDDPVAMELTKDRGWQWPYYGSVDATPEFIRTISDYCELSQEGYGFLFQHYADKNGRSRIVTDAFEDAVEWITTRIDANDEGFLEYKSAIPKGIENQAWKDSWDSYFHEDGTIANHKQGVASIEVQRMTYDALLDAAHIYQTKLNQADKADQLRERAKRLKQSIFTYLWVDEKGGYFAIGTDRDDKGALRPLKIRTSNMGHMLNSRLLIGDEPELVAYRESIVQQLFSPEMLAGNGIRTLANDEIRFRPEAYHNGSVWLWDTYFIAKGLRRHGYYHLAENLSERLFTVINTTKTFPEFVRGDDDPMPHLNDKIVDVWDETNHRINRIEQPPQEVQAWSVAAILALKHYNSTTRLNHDASSELEQSILKQIKDRRLR